MKICPTCNQTYTDETLNFCLADGTVLKQGTTNSNVQPTVFIPNSPATTPNQGFGNQSTPTNQGFGNQPPPPTNQGFGGQYNQKPNQVVINTPTPNDWNQQKSNAVPPKPKSKIWLWILGILGIGALVSVIAFVGLVAMFSTIDDTEPDSSTFTSSTYKNVLSDDFSSWKRDSSDAVKTEYVNNEYVMTSKQAGYFYVFISGKKDFKTTNASTKVTVKNVKGTTTPLGYGLLIHSNPTVALSTDYVFLIDSTTQSYRIAMHTANKETSIIKWTKFSAIRNGTQANDLEVKDEDGKMTFYINGQLATTLQNTTNYKDGIVGIYAGDAIPIAFSNLKLGRN